MLFEQEFVTRATWRGRIKDDRAGGVAGVARDEAVGALGRIGWWLRMPAQNKQPIPVTTEAAAVRFAMITTGCAMGCCLVRRVEGRVADAAGSATRPLALAGSLLMRPTHGRRDGLKSATRITNGSR